jgi:hypothetical protein
LLLVAVVSVVLTQVATTLHSHALQMAVNHQHLVYPHFVAELLLHGQRLVLMVDQVAELLQVLQQHY